MELVADCTLWSSFKGLDQIAMLMKEITKWLEKYNIITALLFSQNSFRWILAAWNFDIKKTHKQLFNFLIVLSLIKIWVEIYLHLVQKKKN